MPSHGTTRAEQPSWRKSSFCASGECVEVARSDGSIVVRNSMEPRLREVRYTPEEWQAFVTGVKAGEFDDLVR